MLQNLYFRIQSSIRKLFNRQFSETHHGIHFEASKRKPKIVPILSLIYFFSLWWVNKPRNTDLDQVDGLINATTSFCASNPEVKKHLGNITKHQNVNVITHVLQQSVTFPTWMVIRNIVSPKEAVTIMYDVIGEKRNGVVLVYCVREKGMLKFQRIGLVFCESNGSETKLRLLPLEEVENVRWQYYPLAYSKKIYLDGREVKSDSILTIRKRIYDGDFYVM